MCMKVNIEYVGRSFYGSCIKIVTLTAIKKKHFSKKQLN